MGEALWDVLPTGKKIGGAPANFAFHVSQFGLPSCVVSAIGDDSLGKEIVENLTSKGLRQHIETVPYPTGTVQVEIDQAGIPQYDIKENVAWDNIPYSKKHQSCVLRLARSTKHCIKDYHQQIPRRNAQRCRHPYCFRRKPAPRFLQQRNLVQFNATMQHSQN